MYPSIYMLVYNSSHKYVKLKIWVAVTVVAYGRGILNSLKNSILPENELKILKNITLYTYTVLQPYDVNPTARTKYINALHTILLRRFIYIITIVVSPLFCRTYYIARDKIRRHIHKCIIIIIYNILRSNIIQDLTARYISSHTHFKCT